MICLTGDVHHASLRTNDQRYIAAGDTEIRITQRYLALVERYGVKVTLYICGKCFTEEWDDLEPVATHPLVEIGGHGYRARQPRPWFDRCGERTGNWNGSRWFQSRDIRRNLDACEAKTGYRFVSWRAHSYVVDPNTYPLLSGHDVKLVSDEVRPDNLWPERIADGLVSHPMNVIPDHDHLYHAHRDRAFVERANRQGYGADGFGAVSYTIEEWGARALEQAQAIEGRGGVATILAHPACMYIADGFKTFERLLDYASGCRTVWARELLGLVDTPPASIQTAGETG